VAAGKANRRSAAGLGKDLPKVGATLWQKQGEADANVGLPVRSVLVDQPR
jgi:hypothetical protein